MHAILAALVISGSPAPQVAQCADHAAMVDLIAAQAQTGTLIFSQGDCLAVKVYSGSPFTHVAAVVVEKNTIWVYDATGGIGVRKLPLAQFVTAMAPDELHVLQPRRHFDDEIAKPFQRHLEQQLGRPYSVKHHLTGNRAEGLHCAEYVTDAMIACDMLRAKNPVRVSPASLLQGITQTDIYRETLTLNLHTAPPPKAVGDNWCKQLWIDTKSCTANCWTTVRRSLFCK